MQHANADKRINAEHGRRCPQCGETKPRSEFHSAYCKPCTAQNASQYRLTNPDNVYEARRKWERRNHAATRDALLNLFGRICVQCGFDDTRALQVDHINGDGAAERKLLKNKRSYYRHILEVSGIGYQLLCANCNMIKRVENQEHRKRTKPPAPLEAHLVHDTR